MRDVLGKQEGGNKMVGGACLSTVGTEGELV